MLVKKFKQLKILLTIAILITTLNRVTVAQDFNNYNIPDNVANIASTITVMLKDKSSDASEFFDSGSGVIVHKVKDEYFVLTVAHNLDSNKDNKIDENDIIVNDYVVMTNDNENYYITNYYIVKNQELGNLDLAILTFKSKNNYQYSKFFNSQDQLLVDLIMPEQDIYVSGFPETTKGKLQIDKGKFLSKHAPWPDDEYIYRKFPEKYSVGKPPKSFTGGYSLEYRPYIDKGMVHGMSGGPILTSDGYLIGVHGRENYTGGKRGIGIDVFFNAI